MILNEILGDYKHYLEFFHKNSWHYIISGLKCPECSHKNPCSFISWGSYTRKLKISEEQGILKIPIKRFNCIVHSKTVSFIPPFLLPRIQYHANTVNAVIESYMSGKKIDDLANDYHIIEERTIRRWIKKLTSKASIVKKKLFSLMGSVFYTTDERILRDQKLDCKEKRISSELLKLWAALKTYSQRIAEQRFPCHYAFSLIL